MEDESKELVPVENTIEPSEAVEFGNKAAKVLKDIIENQPNKVVINGKTYIQYHDWQTIATFYRCTVGTEWSRSMRDTEGRITGYEARAIVKNSEGKEISAAESSCGRDENNWKDKEDFQVRSMAQTRAAVKALRNVFSFVPVLANYSPTPAEEMVRDKTIKNITPPNPEEMVCVKCKKKLTENVYNYSMQQFKTALCYDHQKELKEKIAEEKVK